MGDTSAVAPKGPSLHKTQKATLRNSTSQGSSLDSRSDSGRISAGQAGPVNRLSTPKAASDPPSFEPGNTAALVHGAYSPRFIRRAAQPLARAIVELAPWLRAPEFEPTLENYAETLATARILADMVREITDTKGALAVPSRTWEQLTAARRLVHQIGSDLGLSPIGRARLAALVTSADIGQVTLADLQERGRQILEAHQPTDQENQ